MLGIVDIDSAAPQGLLEKLLPNTLNATESILGGDLLGGAVGKALLDAAPMIGEIAFEYGFGSILGGECPNRTPLYTVYVLLDLGQIDNMGIDFLNDRHMDVSWQWGDSRANPADAARGPQVYDNHLYYSYVFPVLPRIL